MTKGMFIALIISLFINVSILKKISVEIIDYVRYHEVIEEENVTVIEFWAEWNEENEMPIEILNGCNVYRVNVDRSPILVEKYNVHTLPTVVVYKNGVQHARIDGDITFKGRTDIESIQGIVDYLQDH